MRRQCNMKRDKHECWTGVRQQRDEIVRKATLPGCTVKVAAV